MTQMGRKSVKTEHIRISTLQLTVVTNHPLCNSTGNNSEGQRIRRARGHPRCEPAGVISLPFAICMDQPLPARLYCPKQVALASYMPNPLRSLHVPSALHTESQFCVYSVSGRGESAQPNLDSSVYNCYKRPMFNRTGNNWEGQRIRRMDRPRSTRLYCHKRVAVVSPQPASDTLPPLRALQAVYRSHGGPCQASSDRGCWTRTYPKSRLLSRLPLQKPYAQQYG